MLRVQSVSAGYGEEDIIRDISFCVQPNEKLCILGPNGCGKTTLLKVIAGLLPYQGTITLNEASLHEQKPKERAKRIAMMSQNSSIYFTYSVFETVMMGRYVHMKDRFLGMASKEDIQYVESCLKAVDMLNERNRPITQLSGGQLQRIYLARALAQQPDIILLDEPTNHLDLKYQIELIQYLREWSQKENHSVIGVLHDINLAMQLSDRVLMMKDGQIIREGNTNDTVTGELLNYVYDTDVAGYMQNSLKRWEELSNS